MKVFVDVGFFQVVILLYERLFILVLCQLGFSGSDEQVLEKVVCQVLYWFFSVSFVLLMWVVNAVMIVLFVDMLDGKVYFIVVNLNNKFYCLLEAFVIELLLKVIFNDEEKFSVYLVLLQVVLFGDEGAVNYNCFGGYYGELGM